MDAPFEGLCGRLGFWETNSGFSMKNLPLKIRYFDSVMVNDANTSESRSSEILKSRTSESACTDDDYGRVAQFELAFDSESLSFVKPFISAHQTD